MPTPHIDNILWLDFETTGMMTNPDTVPLEGAAIITDGDLNELAVLEGIALQASEESLAAMGDFVRNMHTKTGLLERVAVSTTSVAVFDTILRDFAAPYFPVKGEELPDGAKYRGIVIGGNSVKFDFDVIEKFFTATRETMDYRVIDISGVGELLRRWNRQAWEAMPPKASDHTALTDIREGVKELRYYKECLGRMVFLPQ
jgi:oligoribonuclease